MIYLYIKTHNITGLKYLGKTTSDPFKYKGSGTVWQRHIAKHGNDVTTQILFLSESKDEFKIRALEISKQLDIVESKDFANLCYEEGQGGNTYSRAGKKRPGGHKHHHRSGKSCIVNDKPYKSTLEAASDLNILGGTLRHRLRSPYWPDYRYS